MKKDVFEVTNEPTFQEVKGKGKGRPTYEVCVQLKLSENNKMCWEYTSTIHECSLSELICRCLKRGYDEIYKDDNVIGEVMDTIADHTNLKVDVPHFFLEDY